MVSSCLIEDMGVSQKEAAGTGRLSQGSVSMVCFGVCFGGLFRQSRTSQPYLKLHSPKKMQTHMGLRAINSMRELCLKNTGHFGLRFIAVCWKHFKQMKVHDSSCKH